MDKMLDVRARLQVPGVFWEPTKTESRFSGSIICDGNQIEFVTCAELINPDLSFLRASLGEERSPAPDIVHGFTTRGECTLIGLQERTGDSLADLPNNRGVRVRKFRVSGCIFGFYLEHYATPVLTSSSFTYSGIHEWLPSSSKVTLAEGSATIVSPSQVLTVIDTTAKSTRIRLEVAPNLQFGPAGRWHTGRSESRLTIEPVEARSLQWFTQLAYRFENFFSLCLGTSVRLKTFSLTEQGAKDGFLLRPRRTKGEKPDVAVWIRIDASELAEAICQWFQTPEEFLQLERLIYGTIRHSSLFPETEFLALAQAIEAFHRLTESSSVSSSADFKRTLKALCKVISQLCKGSPLETRFLDGIRHANEPSFHDRFRRPGDATVNDDGDVTIFLGNGDGTFRQGQVLTPGKNASLYRQAMIAVDLNGDQRLDLVVANSGDKTFSVLLGNGDGTFQSPVAYPVVTTPLSIFVVDLTGNGKKDLAVLRIVTVDLWFANGDGTFRQGSSLSASATGVITGDFNGDKKDDLVIHPLCIFHCGGGGSNAEILLGNGDGTFQPAISIGQPASAAADFDGDGNLDLAGTNSTSGSAQILVLLGNGDGTFQPPITVNSNAPLSQVLDVNGDKAPDLVTIGNNSIGLQLNVGTDFSVSASALSPSTLGHGQSATSTISLSLLSLFDNPVALACSVQPAQAGGPTCSLSSNSVTFDGSGKASATLTINAGSSVASRNSFQFLGKGGLLWFPVASFAFLGTGISRKRRLLVVVVGAALFAGLAMQSACGGGSSGSKSTAYTVTVTGSSGATQHSATVNLTVQ
jgi:hypothetical protein